MVNMIGRKTNKLKFNAPLLLQFLCAFWFLVVYEDCFAQETSAESPTREEKKQDDKTQDEKKEPEDTGWTPIKQYSASEKKEECGKFEGRVISYYGNVYLVEDCKFRQIKAHEYVQELAEKKTKIQEIDGSTLAKLSAGKPILSKSETVKKRTCPELEGNYVTFTNTEVYFVESCKRRPFPDWETYVDHRRKQGKGKTEILGLSWDEFESLKQGKAISSILDKHFADLLSGKAGVDVIPIDEACKGLNNQDVSYIDKIYRIENCRKREYDPADFLKQHFSTKLKLPELTAEQWLSLPDGKPMKSETTKNRH